MKPFYSSLLAVALGAALSYTASGQSSTLDNYVANSANSATPTFGNAIVGISAGSTLRVGYYNVFMGDSAAYKVYTCQGCVLIGAKAGFNNTASENTAIGYRAGYNNAANYNTFVGYNAGADGNRGDAIYNTFIGSETGRVNLAPRNTFIGGFTGQANTTGTNNVFIGALSGIYNLDGSENSFVGTFTGNRNTSGSANAFFGTGAGISNTTGNGNVAIGAWAGSSNQTGRSNTMVGDSAGSRTRSSANTLIGYRAGFNNTLGQFNTFVGVQAGINNTTGNSNFIMGTNAGSNNTTGSANFFLGDNAGSSNSTGGFNVFLGTNAGASNTAGDNNTAIGFEANVGGGALTNATAIGFRAVASANNTLVLGNGANVGIGTSVPTSKLHVVSGIANQSGLRLENLTSNSPVSATGQTKFLTVDGAGNVVLGTATSGGRLGADLWQRSGAYLQSIDESAVIIGQGISKTPTEYNLFVSKGILTEKVKVAVKNASEWSDYVFAPSYKLAPLSEVASFIKQKGHLPGVPSAAEVVAEGVDMAKMDAKLLEKIEELTLYSIQQQATIEKQNSRIDELEKQNTKIVELEKIVKQLLERK
jgi:hypothetical protein